MIQLISDLACSLFCVTTNGFTAVAFWFVYQKAVKPFGYWKQTTILMKILILTVLIPWQYIPFILYETYILHGWWRVIPQFDINIVMSVIMLVWLIGAARKAVMILRRFYPIKVKLKDRETVPAEAEKRYRMISSDMGLRRIPRVYMIDDCEIPYLFHSFPAAIYLPKNLMDQDQLEVSLRHELIHYRHRDNVWAWLLRICCILQWWNPWMRYLERQFTEWSEYANDSDAIEKSSGKKHYFEVIINIIDGHEEENEFAQGLGKDTQDDIEKRVDMYNRGRKARKGRRGWLVNTLLVLTLVTSVSATLLLDNAASYAYYIVYREASKLRDVVEEPDPMDHTEVTEIGFPDGMSIKTGEVTYVNQQRSLAEFNWNVPVNTSVTSDSFYLNKGQQVMISIGSTNPTGISVKFGLLRVATNTKTSVTSSAPATHIFTAAAAGYYKVFVENTGGTAFSVYGSFMIL